MHHILEWEGRKLGIIGLVEREWLDTGDTALSNTTKYSLSTTPVSSLDRDHLDYTDYADAASMLAEELKKKGEDDDFTDDDGDDGDDGDDMAGCEYIIAVTHMRTDNDVRLAEKVPEVNLILGGHSQVYEKRKVRIMCAISYTTAVPEGGEWKMLPVIRLTCVFKSNLLFGLLQ